MNTTAGSFSLLGSIVQDDAGVVKRLRTAGVVILGASLFLSPTQLAEASSQGKANMSEWAWFRGNLPSGWSGRGSQCTSAYFPNTNPGGSSSGSGVAASIGLAAVTLGTETGGSITSPSSNNNIVGIKPTVGLTSRAGGLFFAAATTLFPSLPKSDQKFLKSFPYLLIKIQLAQ
jgi:amidase